MAQDGARHAPPDCDSYPALRRGNARPFALLIKIAQNGAWHAPPDRDFLPCIAARKRAPLCASNQNRAKRGAARTARSRFSALHCGAQARPFALNCSGWSAIWHPYCPPETPLHSYIAEICYGWKYKSGCNRTSSKIFRIVLVISAPVRVQLPSVMLYSTVASVLYSVKSPATCCQITP